MITQIIDGVGTICFDENQLPLEGDYYGDRDECIDKNFLTLEVGSHKVFVCSEENCYGLYHYLSDMVFNYKYFCDYEQLIAPDFDFYYWAIDEGGWSALMEGEPAPFRITVDVFEENGRIFRVKENSFFYYLLIDFEEFEENGIPSEYLDEIEKRFKIEVEAYIKDYYDVDEKLSEAPNFQYFSPWMQNVVLEIEKK